MARKDWQDLGSWPGEVLQQLVNQALKDMRQEDYELISEGDEVPPEDQARYGQTLVDPPFDCLRQCQPLQPLFPNPEDVPQLVEVLSREHTWLLIFKWTDCLYRFSLSCSGVTVDRTGEELVWLASKLQQHYPWCFVSLPRLASCPQDNQGQVEALLQEIARQPQLRHSQFVYHFFGTKDLASTRAWLDRLPPPGSLDELPQQLGQQRIRISSYYCVYYQNLEKHLDRQL
jgi:hypothetical protein